MFFKHNPFPDFPDFPEFLDFPEFPDFPDLPEVPDFPEFPGLVDTLHTTLHDYIIPISQHTISCCIVFSLRVNVKEINVNEIRVILPEKIQLC